MTDHGGAGQAIRGGWVGAGGLTGGSAQKRPDRRRPRRGRWLVRAVAWCFVVVVGVPLVCVGAAWPFTPGVGDAAARVRADLAPHGAVPLTRLPQPDRVGQAIIATENSRFSIDPGIDPLGVFRAASGFVTHQNEGAATLEQQLAKRLYTPQDGGPLAQLTDVELAIKLFGGYSKDDILRLYLSDVYFGHGCYGLVQAARGYFGRTPQNLSWAQASLLAGLVQAPSAYDPYVHLHLAKLRQHHVLDRLVATGVLTSSEAAAVYRAPLHLVH